MCREKKILHSQKLMQTKNMCRLHIPKIFCSASFLSSGKNEHRAIIPTSSSQNFFRVQCSKVPFCCLPCFKWTFQEGKWVAQMMHKQLCLHPLKNLCLIYTHSVKLNKYKTVWDKTGRWITTKIRRVRAMVVLAVLCSKKVFWRPSSPKFGVLDSTSLKVLLS